MKKLEGNGLWETSRMIIPEYREQHDQFRGQQNPQYRPELDDQELEEIAHKLLDSMANGSEVEIQVWEQNPIRGVVVQIDRNRVTLNTPAGLEIIPSKHIIGMA